MAAWGLFVVAIAAGLALAAGWGLGRWSADASSSTPTASHSTPVSTTAVTPSTSAGTSQPPTTQGPTAPPNRPVPILMYHEIKAPPPGTALPELFLPAPQFQAELRYLKQHDFHPVTLAQVWAYWTKGSPLPIHPIVLSFDDGFRSQFHTAARMLHDYDWPGVLNLIVAHLHEGTYGLGPREVNQMISWGWEIDSHTLTHPDLTTLHGADLTTEVAGSRRVLQHSFGVPVDFFCYPAGAYDRDVVNAVRAAGYEGATTTTEGVADPSQGRFTLDRIRVNGSTTVDQLAAQLAGLGVTAG